MEGDYDTAYLLTLPRDFYPRPPGGGRPSYQTDINREIKFLSTPSGWRATTHFLRGDGFVLISIHALRVEGDTMVSDSFTQFQISIHALRVEGDFGLLHPLLSLLDFYPRPPGGGRLVMLKHTPSSTDFYPRPPGGGRPKKSIAPLALTYFYPRPPGGGRPNKPLSCGSKSRISIHALRVEGDLSWGATRSFQTIFLSTPSGWRATFDCAPAIGEAIVFLSTPSGWRATGRDC